jgi:glutamate-5-semialdehyde dehydrogenase
METIISLLEKAKAASTDAAKLSTPQTRTILEKIHGLLLAETPGIIASNSLDIQRMETGDPKTDRLVLNELRIKDIAKSLLEIASLPNPAGILISEIVNPNGLIIQKKTVPLGVVGVIYESRPNVTIDVAALCIRSGNACVLRGGTDAENTNTFLVSLIRKAIQECGQNPDIVQLLPAHRKHVTTMLEAAKYIDIIIPRGSQELINFVRKHSLVPTIETGAGVCHTYVEKTADLKKAASLVINAKVSRPSVCNALDTILIDREILKPFLENILNGMQESKVELFADDESFQILAELGYSFLKKAEKEDFGREFLDYKCSVKTVSGYEEAKLHISEYSSRHSEAIVSENSNLCERFLTEIDAAAVYVNASTRFTDGGVFGLGAEIGISTQKLHARGPFALEKLVTEKWIIRGNGQMRT